MTKTTEPVLEPCPFCGSAFKMGQEPHDNGHVGGMFYIYHDYGPVGSAARECPIEVYRHFNSEAEAIAAWNTRTYPAPSPDVAGLVERLLEYCRCDPEQTCLFCDTIPTTLATLSAENGRLASFIMHCIEGEPSQSQGAVDTAIRVMTEQATTIGEQLTENERLRGEVQSLTDELGYHGIYPRPLLDEDQ